MSDIVEISEQIAALWARECDLEDEALLQTDPILRSNLRSDAEDVANERKALHEAITVLPAASLKEALILALFAADYFAQLDAGRAPENKPLRHLHDSIIAALEVEAGLARSDLGLEFLWSSQDDGPLEA